MWYILIPVIAIIYAYNMIMLVRNFWVAKHRRIMADYCFNRNATAWYFLGKPELDNFLPSYGEMMNKFWIWDITKFYLKPLDLDERAALLTKCIGTFGQPDGGREIEKRLDIH